MKKLVMIFLGLSFLSLSSFAIESDNPSPNQTQQNQNIPQPVENKVFDQLVGTWVGQTKLIHYVNVDNSLQRVINIHWALKHQFLISDVKSYDANKNVAMESLGIFALNPKGDDFKIWWFTGFGRNHLVTGTGKVKGNQLIMRLVSSNTIENRTYTITDNQFTNSVKGVATINGRTQPFTETVVYTKQNS